MSDEQSPDQDAYVKEQLNKWDRALLIVSIPHGAAFGTFLGRYDLSKNIENGVTVFYSILVLMCIAPLVTIWLFMVHDLLRNTFLRIGHFDQISLIKNNLLFLFVLGFPVTCAITSSWFTKSIDSGSIMLIAATMISWGFFLILVANNLYLRIAKSLGVQRGE